MDNLDDSIFRRLPSVGVPRVEWSIAPPQLAILSKGEVDILHLDGLRCGGPPTAFRCKQLF